MNTDTHCMGMNVKVHEMQNKDQVPQENPKYLPLTHTHTHTHTHTLSQSWYQSLGPLILKNITCVLKSLNNIILIWVLMYLIANRGPKTLKTI